MVWAAPPRPGEDQEKRSCPPLPLAQNADFNLSPLLDFGGGGGGYLKRKRSKAAASRQFNTCEYICRYGTPLYMGVCASIRTLFLPTSCALIPLYQIAFKITLFFFLLRLPQLPSVVKRDAQVI